MGEPMTVCGHTAPDDALRILAELASCCLASSMRGPTACTCWTVEYDLEQTEPDPEPVDPARLEAQPEMCADCAFRPNSPEHDDDSGYVRPPPDPLAYTFWCHQGMRKPVRFHHPAGITVEASGDFYKPPKALDAAGQPVPFRADGRPALQCAGWLRQRRRAQAGVHVLLEDLDADYTPPPDAYEAPDLRDAEPFDQDA